MRPTVLISGGSGLLALNWALAARERCSVTLGLHRRNVELGGVASRRIDLESVDALVAALDVIEPNVFIHAAGLTSVEECEADPSIARHVNVQLAENVALACAKRGVALVHISTDHLFSGAETMVDESHQPEPQNVYAATKAEAERRVLEVDPQALVVRTNFFAWGTSYRRSFSDQIIAALREDRAISLFEDVFFTPIFVETLANTVHALVDAGATGVFNVVGDERLSKHEFGLQMARIFGLDPRVIVAGTLADRSALVRRPREMSLSNRKARDVLRHGLGDAELQIAGLHHQEELGYARELSSL